MERAVAEPSVIRWLAGAGGRAVGLNIAAARAPKVQRMMDSVACKKRLASRNALCGPNVVACRSRCCA